MSLSEPIGQTEAVEVPYPPRRCFNIYSAAQYCSCKCAAIEQAIHEGDLKAIRLGRTCYVYAHESRSIGSLMPVKRLSHIFHHLFWRGVLLGRRMLYLLQFQGSEECHDRWNPSPRICLSTSATCRICSHGNSQRAAIEKCSLG